MLLSAGVAEQTITVEWRPSPTKDHTNRLSYRIAWDDLPQYNQDYLRRLKLCLNEQQITEKAALGIMALLIHEIEKLSIRTVLPIGGGTDYEVACGATGPGVPVEVRGIREAETLRIPRGRLDEKIAQALEKNSEAIISVTTFHVGTEGCAHSFLHRVRRQPRSRRRKK
jgi:hypothetical protein